MIGWEEEEGGEGNVEITSLHSQQNNRLAFILNLDKLSNRYDERDPNASFQAMSIQILFVDRIEGERERREEEERETAKSISFAYPLS